MFKKFFGLALLIVLALSTFEGMAGATKTTINETQLVTDSYKTPTSVDALASEMQINASKDNRLVLVVANTAPAAGLNVTVLKGVYFRSGLGNLTLTIPKSSSRLIGPLESSRFEQRDGKIYLNFNNTGGTATGYRLPSS